MMSPLARASTAVATTDRRIACVGMVHKIRIGDVTVLFIRAFVGWACGQAACVWVPIVHAVCDCAEHSAL